MDIIFFFLILRLHSGACFGTGDTVTCDVQRILVLSSYWCCYRQMCVAESR